jgi:4-phosphopantoate--beta-alanine ligase
MRIPRSHPRYGSLKTREELLKHLKTGVLARAGLIAHGRGEAFDYLLGEKTIHPAETAEKAAAAHLLAAKNPVISVNGNTAALAAKGIVRLADATGARIEICMFHWSPARGRKIAALLKRTGARKVLFGSEARIPNLDHARARCTTEGIFSADVVLVPLEDGDRAEALINMGKTVIAIDLNPLSRTSRTATVTVVDELCRAVVNIEKHAKRLKKNTKLIAGTIKRFDNRKNISIVLKYINRRLAELAD